MCQFLEANSAIEELKNTALSHVRMISHCLYLFLDPGFVTKFSVLLYVMKNMIVMAMKYRRLGWTRHVARMGAMRNTEFSLENLRRRWNLRFLGIGGRIILKWILKEWMRGHDWIYLAQNSDQWRDLLKTLMNPGIS
jgi:hypothetical protein